MVEYHWDNPQSIVEINKERLAKNATLYNPLVGTVVSADIPRPHLGQRRALALQICIPDAPIPNMLIPREMESELIVQSLRKGKTLRNTARGLFGGVQDAMDMLRVWKTFIRCRQRYDFEFWCATKWHIYDKETAELVPFILNRPQRTVLVPALEKLRKAGKPIDIILLKARQWGGSICMDA